MRGGDSMINELRKQWLYIVGPVALAILWLFSLSLPGFLLIALCLVGFALYAKYTPGKLTAYLVGIITGELFVVGVCVAIFLAGR